jgi:hypothetical protein
VHGACELCGFAELCRPARGLLTFISTVEACVQAPMTRVGDVGNVCAVEGCLGGEMLMLREKAAWGVRC